MEELPTEDIGDKNKTLIEETYSKEISHNETLIENLKPNLSDILSHQSSSSTKVDINQDETTKRKTKRKRRSHHKKKKNQVVFPKSDDPIFQNPDISASPQELLLNHGYYSEIHEVITEDGFIVSILRIPFAKGQTPEKMGSTKTIHSRPIAFFAHGFLMNGISWVLNSDKNVLAYNLAEEGFDVWLINHRGSENSKKHMKYSTSSRKFWNWSFEDIGKFDIPCVLNYILNLVGQPKLTYIGHSMGCVALFVAAAEHPEIVSKIKLMIAYAPAVFISNCTSIFVKTVSRIPGYTKLLGIYHGEFYLRHTPLLMKKFAPWIWFCKSRNIRDSTWINLKMMDLTIGKDNSQINWPFQPLIASMTPSTTSVKNYEHFLQSCRTGLFRKFDYGERKNRKVYNQNCPPEWDLSKATFPVALFCGEKDALVPPKDVKKLETLLPNVVTFHKVDLPKGNHNCFFWGKDADKFVNPQVMDLIHKYL